MDITTRLALQSQATRLTGRVPGGGDRTEQGYDLLRLAVSTTNCTRCPLRIQTQTTIRRLKGADFHIELFPLHSPLLRESWLVSFPPLSNMFKFGGSSCLSPALTHEFVIARPLAPARHGLGVLLPRRTAWMLRGAGSHHNGLRFLKRCRARQRTQSSLWSSLRLANESGPGMLQPRGPEQPFAFKDLMIHLILQFTLHIAFRGVLHRCGNQEIHR